MNKTVTINLSGIIFHIDEDAYQKLQSYLTTIRSYFSESEGRDEIMADIENRIAEMLSEKISDRKQVVLMSDVNYVIGVMGKPEDFAGEKTHSAEQTSYSSSTGKRRRVFRDPDHKILGGVCSGISAYFNIDPLWLRLGLVICFFTFGVGILLYIVLWIIIPQARTSAEKLEMRGEDVNISNIGKKVEEEMHAFGKRMESWGHEVKENVTSDKTRNFVGKVADFLSSVFGAFLKAFVKLLGVLFILIGLSLLAVLISFVLGAPGFIELHGYHTTFHDFFVAFSNRDQWMLASLAIALIAGIPLALLVYGGAKMLLGIRSRNRLVKFFAGILWIVGIALGILLGMQIADQFAESATSRQDIPVAKTKCDTLYLRVQSKSGWEDANRYRRSRFDININDHQLILSDTSTIYFGYPTLDIVKGESDTPQVVIYKEAYGKDKKEALHFSRSISYDFIQKDSLLEFSPYFSISKDEKWRNQRVHIEVRLPKGKTIYIGKNMAEMLSDVHNETDTYDHDMAGRRWQMGEDELHCLDCQGIDSDSNDRSVKRLKRKIKDEIHNEIEKNI